MTIIRKTVFTYSLLALLSLGSCELKGSSEKETQTSYVVKSDESSDVSKLGKLINLEKFRPKKVTFHHTYIETINGYGSDAEPKDDYLQAVLYFDSLTFQKMLEMARNADYPSSKYSKTKFAFPWLDRGLSNELQSSASTYHGHPDLFFGTENGELWFLDKKILFYREIK